MTARGTSISCAILWRSHLSVQDGLTRSHEVDTSHHILAGRIVQKVSLCTGTNGGLEDMLVIIGAEKQDGDSRIGLPDDPADVDATGSTNPSRQNYHVRLTDLQGGQSRAFCACRADDLDMVALRQKTLQAMKNDARAIDQQHVNPFVCPVQSPYWDNRILWKFHSCDTSNKIKYSYLAMALDNSETLQRPGQPFVNSS